VMSAPVLESDPDSGHRGCESGCPQALSARCGRVIIATVGVFLISRCWPAVSVV
jgi:hypothetical protein